MYFNKILDRLESSLKFINLGDSFESFFKYGEKFYDVLGNNVFDMCFGSMKYRYNLRFFLFVLSLVISTSSGVLSAFGIYKDILEEQLSSLIAASFALMVSKDGT